MSLMKRRESFLPVFFVVVFLCIVLLTFSISGKLKLLSFLEKPVASIQGFSYSLFQKLPFTQEDSRIKKLKEENLELLSKVAGFDKLEKENAALSDQFQTYYPQSVQLLEARIVGAPGVNLILNKGSKDNLKEGMAVVVKDNLVGIISDVSVNLSKVNLVNNPSFLLTVKTEFGAQGVIKGTGAGITLDNVLLSDNIKNSEIVYTLGDIDLEGIGVPPDLIVGKIIEIEKNPSELFQKAKIESFIDFSKLSIVFVYINSK